MTRAAQTTPGAVVTGAASGIGLGLCEALVADGARVVMIDRDVAALQTQADRLGAHAIACDLCDADAFAPTFDAALSQLGRIDLWISNAGRVWGEPEGLLAVSDATWAQGFDLHVMAHLRAARHVLPHMTRNAAGAFVNVASAAGLLCQIGDAAYSASKAAAVSLAQSLALEVTGMGVHVAVACPMYVATPLLGYGPEDTPEETPDLLSATTVARLILDGVAARDFLIVPHPEARAHFLRRAGDTDRWIEGMRRLHTELHASGAPGDPSRLHRRT